MKTNEIVVILAVAALLLIFFLFITAKGEKKRITIVNPDGERIALDVEIADNPATRAKGLMGRSSLGEYEGMLFVFDKPGIHRFWMVNTTIPLDAIYISEDGTVVDIIQMEPCGLNITKCRLYAPKAEAKYVLEADKGFSEEHAIIIGKSRLLLE